MGVDFIAIFMSISLTGVTLTFYVRYVYEIIIGSIKFPRGSLQLQISLKLIVKKQNIELVTNRSSYRFVITKEDEIKMNIYYSSHIFWLAVF